MTLVNRFLNSLSREQIAEIVRECLVLDTTGVMPDGVTKQVAKQLADQIRVLTPSECRKLIEKHAFRQAAVE